MPRRLRSGYSLVELLVVLTIVGVVLAISVPRTLLVLDRLSVHSAAGDVAATLNHARALAIASHAAVAVHVAKEDGTLRIQRGADVLLTRNVGLAHGVELHQTRDSLAYDGWGLGVGAANLSIIVYRRSAAETVFVSRLGRVR